MHLLQQLSGLSDQYAKLVWLIMEKNDVLKMMNIFNARRLRCVSSCIAYIAEEHDAGWWMTEWWKGSYTPLKHLLQVFWVD